MQMTNLLVGGMRLEYPVVVRSYGAEPLCKTPIDLHIKTLNIIYCHSILLVVARMQKRTNNKYPEKQKPRGLRGYLF